MFGEFEHSFLCPYCNASISMVLEIFYNNQSYIEDCEVCCNPIQISYMFTNEELKAFNAESLEQ